MGLLLGPLLLRGSAEKSKNRRGSRLKLDIWAKGETGKVPVDKHSQGKVELTYEARSGGSSLGDYVGFVYFMQFLPFSFLLNLHLAVRISARDDILPYTSACKRQGLQQRASVQGIATIPFVMLIKGTAGSRFWLAVFRL